MEAITTKVCRLGELDARAIIRELTKQGSEFQSEVRNRAGSQTPLALVRNDEYRIAAWAAVHEWRGMQSLQAFTHPDMRRRGLARLAVAILAADGLLDTSKTTAVFSPECIGIAQSLQCRDARLFENRNGDWTETS